MTLQVLASQEKARGGEVSAEDLVHYSRLYRAALHECVLGLRGQDQGEGRGGEGRGGEGEGRGEGRGKGRGGGRGGEGEREGGRGGGRGGEGVKVAGVLLE